MNTFFKFVTISGETIVYYGVAKLFYQDGLPLSFAIEEFQKKGIKVSLFHIIDQLWNTGWSSKTILSKLKDECLLDVNNTMKLNWDKFDEFTNLLEQPLRGQGGYEKSREIIFNSLFTEQTVKKFLSDI